VNEIATELLLRDPRLAAIMSRAIDKAGSPYEGEWQGRAALWALGQAVDVLYPVPAQQPDPEKSPFPLSLSGFGFDERRRSSEQLGPGLETIRFRLNTYLQDLQAFAGRLKDPAQGQAFVNAVVTSTTQLYARLDSIRRYVADVDLQRLLRSKYLFTKRVHTGWLFLLTALSFVAGVLAPLLLLIWRDEFSRFGATILTVGALIFTLGACALFAMDVATPPALPRQQMLKSKWYDPLLHELSSVESKIQGAVILDGPLIGEALLSDDAREFPDGVRLALKNYQNAVEPYNRTAVALGDFVVHQVQALGACAPPRQTSGQGRIITPGSMLRQGDVDALVQTIAEDMNTSVTLELQHANWSRVACTLSREMLPKSKLELGKKLHDIRLIISASHEAHDFEATAALVTTTAVSLKRELEKATQTSS